MFKRPHPALYCEPTVTQNARLHVLGVIFCGALKYVFLADVPFSQVQSYILPNFSAQLTTLKMMLMHDISEMLHFIWDVAESPREHFEQFVNGFCSLFGHQVESNTPFCPEWNRVLLQPMRLQSYTCLWKCVPVIAHKGCYGLI